MEDQLTKKIFDNLVLSKARTITEDKLKKTIASFLEEYRLDITKGKETPKDEISVAILDALCLSKSKGLNDEDLQKNIKMHLQLFKLTREEHLKKK